MSVMGMKDELDLEMVIISVPHFYVSGIFTGEDTSEKGRFWTLQISED